MRRVWLVMGISAALTAGLAACLETNGAAPALDDGGPGADSGQATDATVSSLDGSGGGGTDAGADSSPRQDATPATDATSDVGPLDAGDLDAGDLDAAGDGAADAGTPDAGDAEAPVVLVDGSVKPVLAFDFNDTTLVYRTSGQYHTCPLSGCTAPVASTPGVIPDSFFTVSGPRLYFVLPTGGGGGSQIQSMLAETLTGSRKENLYYCFGVQYLRAEASTTIGAYRASMSPTGMNPLPYTLAGTPNLSRTGISSRGHCLASGCETATHTYAIVGGSIVRTPK